MDLHDESHPARFIWGKSDQENHNWLPVWVHLLDTRNVSEFLWDEWIPPRIKHILLNDMNYLDELDVKRFLGILAGMHDLGKITPDFGSRKIVRWNTEELFARMANEGFSFPIQFAQNPHRHEIYSGAICSHINAIKAGDSATLIPRKELKKHDQIASILASHHGRPTTSSEYRTVLSTSTPGFPYQQSTSLWGESLTVIINTLFREEDLQLLELIKERELTLRSQILLTSLVIMSDWLASSSDLFPLIDINTVPELDISTPVTPNRYHLTLERLGLSAPFMFNKAQTPENLTEERFGFQPNDTQLAVTNYLENLPSYETCLIIEAPMGLGKTEASLVAAEIMGGQTGSSGFFFGLPTMATTNAMHARMEPYMALLAPSQHVRVQHSKSSFYSASKQAEGHVLPNSEWIDHGTRKTLAPFIAGTVDSFLLTSLKMKYPFWRFLGFASKVIIIDEVHSYDPYMLEYLKASLVWAGYFQMPAILLSATLPPSRKEQLLTAYQQGREYLQKETNANHQ